jgi:hypothetical protein
MSDTSSCPQCGVKLSPNQQFCTSCGYKITSSGPVTVTIRPKDESLKKNIFSQVKSIGSRAQEAVKGDSASNVMTKAKEFKNKATRAMTPENASEIVTNLVNIMIQVARDVRKELPKDMINAIDLEAEMNFVAFSVGVSIDLEQIKPPQTTSNLVE